MGDNNKILKRWIWPLTIVGTVFVVIIVTLIVIFNKPKPPSEDVQRQAHDEVLEGVTNKEIVQHDISKTHDVLNDLTGYGEIERYYKQDSDDWKRFDEENSEKIIKPIKDLTILLDKSGDKEVKKDLSNVIALVEIAKRTHDSEALRLAHRVIHDLDYFVFSPEKSNGDYWGYTNKLDGIHVGSVETYIQ